MFKCLSKLTLALVLGLVVIFGSNIKDNYYRSQIGDSVVRIYNMQQSSGGTGFHIKAESGRIYILTNKHVCGLADENDMVIIEKNGEEFARQVYKRYVEHDLCLVDAISQDYSFIDIASFVEKGEDIIVVGHPGLRRLTLAHGEFIGKEKVQLNSVVNHEAECDGTVQFYGNGMLECIEIFVSSAISSPIYGGNSGSPVVNKWGNVIGVVFAGNRSQVNDAYMVPLNYVKDFLKGL
jgi:S1-C subfamily serine protease